MSKGDTAPLWVIYGLSAYLIVVAVGACATLIAIFPVPRGTWSGASGAASASSPSPPAPTGGNATGAAAASGSAVVPSSSPSADGALPSGAAARAPGAAASSSAAAPAAPAQGAPGSSPAVAADRSAATSGWDWGTATFFGWTLTVRGGDQGLVLLALLAGLLGSFMHASQSLGAYVGNRQFHTSWVLWYILRPPVGGVLGLLFYFILRAGLIPAATSQTSEAVSPYGVVAFGALAGWFSKRATDKLAEIFETLFRTAKDLEYKDKLAGNGKKPKIVGVDPPKIKSGGIADAELVLDCEDLASDVWVSINGNRLPHSRQDERHIRLTIPRMLTATPGAQLVIVVTNFPPAGFPASAQGFASDPTSVLVE